jgi:phage portal protein BeeE
MKWSSLSINSQDAELVEAFRMTVEDIARAFRVPLPLIGDTRNSTYNNVEQLISAWLATGLGFVLEHVEQALGRHFDIAEDTFINFDVDSLLRTDFAGRIDALTKGISGGLYSPNEARAKEGLAAVEFGDEPRVQAQNVPLSAAGKIPAAGSAPTAPAAPQPEEKPKEPEEKPPAEDEKILSLYIMRKKMLEAAA